MSFFFTFFFLLCRSFFDPDFFPLNFSPFLSLYSLGKKNPLSRPILHGLCTLAFGVRAVINSSRAGASGDASLVRTVKGRMSSHVFPGETLRTELWLLREGEEEELGGAAGSPSSSSSSCSCSSCASSPSKKRGKNYRKVVFVTSVVERGTRAITGAAVELGDPEEEETEEGHGARSRL